MLIFLLLCGCGGMADAADSKSAAPGACGFKSRHPHLKELFYGATLFLYNKKLLRNSYYMIRVSKRYVPMFLCFYFPFVILHNSVLIKQNYIYKQTIDVFSQVLRA